MAQDERPPETVEPETSFEPVTQTESEAEQTATRRAVNLASHTGVGVAGAGGVVAVQQLTRSEGDGSASSAETLDVFQDAGEAPAIVEPRGVSADAEPVMQQSTSTTGAAAQPVTDESPVVQPATRPVDPTDTGTASFSPPVTPGNEPVNSFAPAANIPPPVQQEALPATDDVPEEDVDVEELERNTYLASAEVEIGGGFAADADDVDAGSIFGASSEYGALPVDDLPDAADDDEDLASAP